MTNSWQQPPALKPVGDEAYDPASRPKVPLRAGRARISDARDQADRAERMERRYRDRLARAEGYLARYAPHVLSDYRRGL